MEFIQTGDMGCLGEAEHAEADETAFDRCDGLLAEQMRIKLLAAGLNLTQQRMALCWLLFMSGDRHVTVDMLCLEAHAMSLPLSSGAIASALRQFVDAGLLREVALFGPTIWYDTNTGSHFHFYDEDAKQLYDMPANLVPQLNLAVFSEIDVVGVDLIVRIRRRPDHA